MQNMKRFTPLYTIVHGIMNSTENLRFDKEAYFHVLVYNCICKHEKCFLFLKLKTCIIAIKNYKVMTNIFLLCFQKTDIKFFFQLPLH